MTTLPPLFVNLLCRKIAAEPNADKFAEVLQPLKKSLDRATDLWLKRPQLKQTLSPQHLERRAMERQKLDNEAADLLYKLENPPPMAADLRLAELNHILEVAFKTSTEPKK